MGYPVKALPHHLNLLLELLDRSTSSLITRLKNFVLNQVNNQVLALISVDTVSTCQPLFPLNGPGLFIRRTS